MKQLWRDTGYDVEDGVLDSFRNSGLIAPEMREALDEEMRKTFDPSDEAIQQAEQPNWRGSLMVDWGELANKGLGKLKDGVEWGQEKAGQGIDWATDRAGDGLERLGQDAMADVKSLDSGHWKGEAADAFRDTFQTLPTDWLRAADAWWTANSPWLHVTQECSAPLAASLPPAGITFTARMDGTTMPDADCVFMQFYEQFRLPVSSSSRTLHRFFAEVRMSVKLSSRFSLDLRRVGPAPK
ncbi:putative T7SS-secreted protein [Streptomyces scopuliridis]|uniref:putative T7SS-secreted protein n=1 Tax=Streptomyces scopuliridis TaxID=452529 RepID=UPI003687EB9F